MGNPDREHDAVVAAEAPRTFGELAREIAERTLPAFGTALQDLFAATEDANSSGQRIAELILRDPALTSRVLRAANAAHLGLAGQARVVTVSRAVVVLGTRALRSICVSALAVEALDGGERWRHRVRRVLRQALHAAVQARELGLRQRMERAVAERLFVEALLISVGELAFWCYGGEWAERLDAALSAGLPPAAAEAKVLGTSLESFSRDLLRAWNLGGVLTDSPTSRLARDIAAVAEGGWTSPAARRATTEVATLLRVDEATARGQLELTASHAAELVRALGVPEGDAPAEPATVVDLLEPNPQQQVRALIEMGSVASSRRDVPLVLEVALEGLHRAVGLDRAVLCLLNPARTRISARMAVGPYSDGLRQAFAWDWNAELESALPAQGARWFAAHKPAPATLLQAGAAPDCFVAAFSVDRRVVGMFYADRSPSGRPLNSELFEGFQAFVSQAQLVVQALPREGGGG